jgi:hypothetical protein
VILEMLIILRLRGLLRRRIVRMRGVTMVSRITWLVGRVRGLIWVGLLITVGVPPISGKQIGGVEVPDHMDRDGVTLRLYGAALKEVTFLAIDVYAVGLFLEDLQTPPEEVLFSPQQKSITLTFLRDVTREKLAQAWVRDLAVFCRAPCDSLLDQAQEAAMHLPDIKKGQTVSYHLSPGRAKVYVGEKYVGEIVGDSADCVVLGAFIGERAPLKLREGLLRRSEN